MPPRRAMDAVAMEYFKCQGLMSNDCTVESIIKTAARTKEAATCTEALLKYAAGATCSGRAKLLIEMDRVDPDKALRVIASEHPECKEVESLKCTSQDLHYPEETCTPNAFNNYKEAAPAALLSVGNSGSNSFGPLVHCSGISVETEKCEGDLDLAFVDSKEAMGRCLAHGQYHLVKTQTRVNSKTARNAVPVVGAVAAKLGGRSIDDASPSKVILVTRNPLSVVFSWAEAVLGGLAANDVEGHNDISVSRRNLKARIDMVQYDSLAKSREGDNLILASLKEIATSNIEDWEELKTFIDNPAYTTMMVTGEEYGDPMLQPSMLAEVSTFLGIAPNHTAIFNGIQAMENIWSSKPSATGPSVLTARAFFLGMSDFDFGMPRICQMIEQVPSFSRSIGEQGYGSELAELTAFCPGFDESWIVAAGEPLFVGFSDRM